MIISILKGLIQRDIILIYQDYSFLSKMLIQ